MDINLTIKLENSYGIRSLEHTFCFEKNANAFAIYAPNGVMKTSFAKSFFEYSQGRNPKDEVFDNRKTIALIKQNDKNWPAENIFVITSYNERPSLNKMSTFLANNKFREEYAQTYEDIERSKKKFISDMSSISGIPKKQLVEKIEYDFKRDGSDLFSILNFL